MLIDFHTHLHSYDNPSQAIDCIKGNAILSVACSEDVASYLATREMARASNFIVPTFGVHPCKSGAVRDLRELDSHLNDSAIIGEIGMDDYWFKDVDLDTQKAVFEYILNHCDERQKYCVIHTKGAEERIYTILQKYPNAKPVIHWYSGPIDIFKKLLARKFHFTFGCEVYYSAYIRELLSITPPCLILSETDNPSSEVWLGGNTDSPLLIRRVVDDIAKVKNINGQEMECIIQENVEKIFRESGLDI
jgi:TatD DNase family protein